MVSKAGQNDDFSKTVSKWIETVKGGLEIDDETYREMLSECVGAIIRSVQGRDAVSLGGHGPGPLA